MPDGSASWRCLLETKVEKGSQAPHGLLVTDVVVEKMVRSVPR